MNEAETCYGRVLVETLGLSLFRGINNVLYENQIHKEDVNMTVKLLDYRHRPVEVEVGDIETIGCMRMEVLSGDEILEVIRKDFTIEKFDSYPGGRYVGYPDGEYDVYNPAAGINLFNKAAFMNRTSSYWFYEDMWEEEP
jgi:hypothetical protein